MRTRDRTRKRAPGHGLYDPWHSSACARVRYAKTIPRCRGIAYPQHAESQRIGWQENPRTAWLAYRAPKALSVTSLQIPSGAENLVLEQGREVFVLFEEAVELFERFCAVSLVEEGVNPVLREEDVAGALDVWQSGERFGDVAGSLLLS